MRISIKLSFIVAIVLIASAASAPAGSLKGAELLAMLAQKPSNDVQSIVEKSHAMGYLTGLLEALVMMNDINPEIQSFCLPSSGISAGEAKGMIVNWLKEHPQRQDEQARLLVLYFLQDVFPCPIEQTVEPPRKGALSE
jgi:hypothetical protein